MRHPCHDANQEPTIVSHQISAQLWPPAGWIDFPIGGPSHDNEGKQWSKEKAVHHWYKPIGHPRKHSHHIAEHDQRYDEPG